MQDARNLDDFLKTAASLREAGPFQPCSFYNSSGDSLEIYASNEDHVAERINTLFTVFVSRKDRHKVTGLVIKNLRKHFGKDSKLNFLVAAGKAKVGVLLRGAQLAQETRFEHESILDRAGLVEKALETLGSLDVDVPSLRRPA